MKTSRHEVELKIHRVLAYLRSLPGPRVLLWCYLLWYLYAVARHFDASPALWTSSIGLSAIIGTGLYVSTAYAGRERARLPFWPVFRFYLMPFCVSSFAASIKGQGFVLIFHPTLLDNAVAFTLCGAFVLLVVLAKQRGAEKAATS